MLRRIAILGAFLALGLLPANAQDVVHLKGGEQIAGKLTDGLLAVKLETSAGEIRVPWNRIDRIDRAVYVRTLYSDRAKDVGADDAAGHFLLALWCRRQGLEEEMQAELLLVLEADPDHAGARGALGQEKVGEKWVAGDQMLAAKGFVRKGDRWLLTEEAAHEEAVRESRKPLTETEEKAKDLIVKAVDENARVRKYARAALESLPFTETRIPLFRALGSRDPAVRAFAASELGRLREIEAVRPLLRTAILDSSETVRAEAVRAVRLLDEPGALYPMIRALASTHAQIRTNAAQAIGGFGDIRGVEYLVRRMSQNWGPSQRNNLTVMNQVSYVQDFDVEIAQAAQIGDPIVQTLREGVILDVQILGASRKFDLIERRVIRGALSRLTGQDLGDDALAWEKWWGDNRERLLAKAK